MSVLACGIFAMGCASSSTNLKSKEELAHRLDIGEILPEPAVRAPRDFDFAAA